MLLVNEALKGQGKGSSKQAAKELAAKEALYTMGWDASQPVKWSGACYKGFLSANATFIDRSLLNHLQYIMSIDIKRKM